MRKAQICRKCSLTFLTPHYNLGTGRGMLFRWMPYFPWNHRIIIFLSDSASFWKLSPNSFSSQLTHEIYTGQISLAFSKAPCVFYNIFQKSHAQHVCILLTPPLPLLVLDGIWGFSDSSIVASEMSNKIVFCMPGGALHKELRSPLEPAMYCSVLVNIRATKSNPTPVLARDWELETGGET